MRFEEYELKTDRYGFQFAKNDIMLGKEENHCIICGRPTKFIEVCSEAYFCSDECVRAFDKMYFEALEQMGEEKYEEKMS